MLLRQIIQLSVSGIAMGFIYALVAIEYTLIWNSTGLLNFSHDKMIMLGAYIIAAVFFDKIGLPVYLCFVFSTVIMILVGFLLSNLVFIRLSKLPTIFSVMGTILIGQIIREAIRLWLGSTPYAIKGLMTGVYRMGNIAISKANVYIIVVAGLVLLALMLFINHTKIGKAMKCVNQNKNAAALMGIDVQRNIMITTAISLVVCLIIGFMLIPLYGVNLNMTSNISTKGFAAGAVGGFGYLPGCIVGGIIVGLIESISVLAIPSIYKDYVSFLVLIVVLLLKPQGILGKKA